MNSETSIQWWMQALVTSCAGLIVSLTLCAALVLGLHHEVGWVKSLERSGADLGAMLVSSLRPHDRQFPVKFAFVDVDAEACKAFENNKFNSRCKSGNPVTPALIAAFVKAARIAKAAVVVIDSNLGTREEQQLLRDELVSKTETGTWVIAPIYGRPAGEAPELYGDFSQDLTTTGAEGRLRLAAFLAGPDGSGDGTIRRYPMSVRVTVENSERIVPSAAYLVPMLLDDTLRREADCTYWEIGCPTNKTDLRTSIQAGDAQISGWMPIPYSIPSLAMLDHGQLQPSQTAVIAAELGYHRLVASRVLKKDPVRFELSANDVEGRVVVLGSSGPAGTDLHYTPIGPMAGPEIVLNAIRGFMELRASSTSTPVALAPSPWARYVAKAHSALYGFLVMTAAWLLIHLLSYRKAFAAPGRQWLYRAGSTVTFFGGLLCATYWELSNLAGDLRVGHFQGLQIDLLTPVLLICLEGYAEGMKWVLDKLEHGMVRLVSLIYTFFK